MYRTEYFKPSRVSYVGYGEVLKKSGYKRGSFLPGIKKVIFNDPATIVLWEDGTKTVVKAIKEAFDPEKGLAMAIAKKALGNEGNYFNTIKKWTEGYDNSPKTLDFESPWKDWADAIDMFADILSDYERSK